jgi:hypothetical protein
MLIVVGLVRTPAARVRLSAAAVGRGEIVFCDQAGEVQPLVAAYDATAVLIEPQAAPGEQFVSLLEAIRSETPLVHIAIYSPLDPESVRTLIPLIEAGANEVVLHEHDDPAAWIRGLSRAPPER